jgi:putative protease
MNVQRKTRTELLSPAGQWESMRAAVANGADAVYFGLSDFSARKRAANFGLDELPAVMDFLRGHNVRGYVAFNTLIFSDELPAAAKFVEAIAGAGVDAAIVQDVGLARLIRRMAPTLAIHASTQMTQTDAEGIALLRELGVSRVILARELTLSQIREIAAAGSMEIEVFVHGALCMSYSGQCLASESLLGRSANRGLCAQACRLPYELVGRALPDTGTGECRSVPDLRGDHATYLLSPRDLGAWDLVKELVDVPVAGLKIEGRLKSPHYVAAATAIYRQALDEALAGRTFEITDAQMAQLEMSFSRGFTCGFLGGQRRTLVDGRFGNSRGQFLGTVVGKAGSGIIIESGEPEHGTRRGGPVSSSVGSERKRDEETHGRDGHATEPHGRDAHATSRPGGVAVKPGDGLVFDDGAERERPPGGRVYRVRPAGAAQGAPNGLPRVEVLFGRNDLDPGAVAVGSEAWKTDDPALRAELEKTWARDVVIHRAPLDARVTAAVGNPLRVEMWECGTGIRAEVESEQSMEASRQHPLTLDLLRKQLGRLGGTPFELGEVELVDGDGNACQSVPVMAPASVLNDIRRQAVGLLLARRKAVAAHHIADGQGLETLRQEARGCAVSPSEGAQADAPCMHVLVRDLGQLAAALAWQGGAARDWETLAGDAGVSRSLTLPARNGRDGCEMGAVYCDFENVDEYEQAIATAKAAGAAVGVAAPRIVKPGEYAVLDAIAKLSPAVVLVRNLASMAWFRRYDPQLPLVCDFSLNAANELSARWLVGQGALRITPSYDLNMQQFAAMAGRFVPGELEAVIHFNMPMFHTEHCLLSGSGTAANITAVAPTSLLRDRMGVEHPVVRDCLCRNTVYNAHAQSAAFFVEQILKLGVRHFRVELLAHAPLEVGPLLDVYSQLIQGRIDGREAWRDIQSLNPDGLTRGTWELA